MYDRHTQHDSKRANLCPPCLTKRSFMARVGEYMRGDRCDGCRRVTKVAPCVRESSTADWRLV